MNADEFMDSVDAAKDRQIAKHKIKNAISRLEAALELSFDYPMKWRVFCRSLLDDLRREGGEQ